MNEVMNNRPEKGPSEMSLSHGERYELIAIIADYMQRRVHGADNNE